MYRDTYASRGNESMGISPFPFLLVASTGANILCKLRVLIVFFAGLLSIFNSKLLLLRYGKTR